MQFYKNLGKNQFDLMKECVTEWREGKIKDKVAMIVISNIITKQPPITAKDIAIAKRLMKTDKRLMKTK